MAKHKTLGKRSRKVKGSRKNKRRSRRARVSKKRNMRLVRAGVLPVSDALAARKKEIAAVARIWYEASTFEDLCDAMVISLTLKCATPFMFADVNEGDEGMLTRDTVHLVKKLIKIADTNKLFTIVGQPGICIKTDKYEEKQRGFMECFIKNEYITEFIEKMPKDIAIIIYDYKKQRHSMHNYSTTETDWYIPNSRTINLTKYISNDDHNDINYDTNHSSQSYRCIEDLNHAEDAKEFMCHIMLIEHEMCKEKMVDKILKALL